MLVLSGSQEREYRMKLYLVRHAEPLRKEEDPERPLSERGWSDIRKIATFVSSQAGVRVKGIMHSGKTRARQTAEALAESLNPPEGLQEVDGLNPLDDLSVWAERLENIEEDIMLVGHLPYLEKLTAQLVCHDEDEVVNFFRSAGIVCLERNEEEGWAIAWMVVPEILSDS